jgi:hypothetical protein
MASGVQEKARKPGGTYTVLISCPDRLHALPQTVIIIPNQRWHIRKATHKEALHYRRKN